MRKKILASIAIMCLAGCAATGQRVELVRVKDGDTVLLRWGGREEAARLLRIDTPERGEPGHTEATAALRGIQTGRALRVEFETPGVTARGHYGRLLVYLFAEGLNVNLAMVRLGHSAFDTTYGEGRLAAAFREAEHAGKKKERFVLTRKAGPDTSPTMTIGDRIRDRMIELVWSQGKLARQMGVSQGYVSKLLRRRPGEPGPQVIGRLLKALGLPSNFFSDNGSAQDKER